MIRKQKNRKGFLLIHIFPSTQSAVPQSESLFVMSAKIKMESNTGRTLPAVPFFLYFSVFFAVEWSKSQRGASLLLLIVINATGGMKRIGIEYSFLFLSL
jgi:hypothetical protein